MFVVEINDLLLLPLLQPKIPGDLSIMLVGLAIPLLPVVILARRYPKPSDEKAHRQLGTTDPGLDKINNRIADIVGNPDVG